MKASGVSSSGSSSTTGAPPFASRAPEPKAGREEELLPRVRPDGVAEARVVLAALEPVGPRLLPVGPADRQLGRALELVVDDRAVAHRRAEHAEARRRKAPIRSSSADGSTTAVTGSSFHDGATDSASTPPARSGYGFRGVGWHGEGSHDERPQHHSHDRDDGHDRDDCPEGVHAETLPLRRPCCIRANADPACGTPPMPRH